MAFLFAFGIKWCLLLRYEKDLYNQGNTILLEKGKPVVVGSLDFSLTIYCRYSSFGTRTCSRSAFDNSIEVEFVLVRCG